MIFGVIAGPGVFEIGGADRRFEIHRRYEARDIVIRVANARSSYRGIIVKYGSMNINRLIDRFVSFFFFFFFFKNLVSTSNRLRASIAFIFKGNEVGTNILYF